ncbi:MAG: hypothetical protein RI101_04360 [Nitrospira sp.]|jgi:hypothetical protein|nr:hypothetical protein [Nitrospira sp.]
MRAIALYGAAMGWAMAASLAWAGVLADLQEHGKAMIKDAEEMVMHGGMGDGKAIVHHCGEVANHAAAILKLLPPSDEHGKEAAPLLKEAIAHCARVAEMGARVDPGASLNPAVKARAAARAAMKHLKEVREHGA